MMASETRQLPDGAVVGVVVTRHRRELLADSLKIIAAQTRPVDHLVVVDNGPDDSAREVVENYPLPYTYLPSHRNLGGAGGFALGMLHALSLGADWLWLADDESGELQAVASWRHRGFEGELPDAPLTLEDLPVRVSHSGDPVWTEALMMGAASERAEAIAAAGLSGAVVSSGEAAVVPAGEVTCSRSTVGCCPVSLSMVAAP